MTKSAMIDMQFDWVNRQGLQRQDFDWGTVFANEEALKKLPRFRQLNRDARGNEVVLLGPVDGLINFAGSSNMVAIGGQGNKSAKINLNFWGNNSRFMFGPQSTSNGLAAEFIHGDTIIIGYDCMLATEIVFRPNDMHPIFDLSGTLINRAKPIIVRDHVWIGQRAMIIKGVEIGAGAIVGIASVVTKAIPPACAVGGVPAKIIRRNVGWTRSGFPDEVERSEAMAFIQTT